jgi:hypothetical protein
MRAQGFGQTDPQALFCKRSGHWHATCFETCMTAAHGGRLFESWTTASTLFRQHCLESVSAVFFCIFLAATSRGISDG